MRVFSTITILCRSCDHLWRLNSQSISELHNWSLCGLCSEILLFSIGFSDSMLGRSLRLELLYGLCFWLMVIIGGQSVGVTAVWIPINWIQILLVVYALYFARVSLYSY